MTAPVMTIPEGTHPDRGRTIELVLAHMHLKLGSLELSRVELETLAGIGGLDPQGLVDLAEVRWRTGDLLGAGEAAVAALRADSVDPIALVVAAEAASAIGRPSEARRLAKRVMASPDEIDHIFAGMPRSNVWAPDANEPAPTAPTLFDRGPEVAPAAEPHTPAPVEEPAASAATAAAATGPMTLGFWDTDQVEEDASATQPDPAREYEAGRVALVAGSVDEAALRFGLALRHAPALAPAVLEATEGARAASLSVVRGDAYRLAGHETEARQAYAIAARGGLPERRATVRVRPKPPPAPVVDVSDEPDESDEHDGPDEGAEATEALDDAEAATEDASEASTDASDQPG